jgi:hypothetical protein
MNYADLLNVEDKTLDFAFVDETDREGCVRSVVSKLNPDALFYLDNSFKSLVFLNGGYDVLKQHY